MKRRANIWPFGKGQPLGAKTTHHRRASKRVSAKALATQAKGGESERLERKLSDAQLEAKLRKHYSRGGNLREFLQANPGVPGAQFKRCVAAVAAQGGAVDPRAVCAAAGRKKYGAKGFAAMAEAGRKQAARAKNRNPSDEAAARRNAKRPRGLWPQPYEVDEAVNRRAQAMARTGRKFSRVDSDAAADKLIAELYGRSAIVEDSQRAKVRNLLWNDFQDYPKGFKGFHRTAAGRRTAKAKIKYMGIRGNPSDAAADVYEEFHGRPSSEVVTVSEKIHYHEHLAALGELRSLVAVARDGAKITLSRFKKAILCCNEAKTQMFIRGGDQAVDLAAFGIRKPHEVETLGRVVELAYFTRKDHLGDEGGTALYFHVAGETNENGKRKMAGWGPDLIYRVLDESLEFSGGSYTIRAEGVDK